MGDSGKPTLMNLPPPRPINQEVTSGYFDLLKEIGPQAQAIFNKAGTPVATGGETPSGGVTNLNYDPNLNLGRAQQISQAAGQRQTDIGRENILGSFAGMGLRASSAAVTGVRQFESQVARDQLNTLQQLQLGFEPLRLQAAQVQAGFAESERERGFKAGETARERTRLTGEAARGREMLTAITWQAMIQDMAQSYYQSATIVQGGQSNIPGIVQAGAGVGAMLIQLLPLLAGLCWVAEAIFGPNHPKVFAARRFISVMWKGRLANFTRKQYWKHGFAFSKCVKRSWWLRLILRPLFDIAAWKGRELCR